MSDIASCTDELAATGVSGLDDVLHGGLTPERLYLVQGTPGAGKTTLALQFLLTGAAQGESGLYITLSETEEELRAVAASHGWSLEDNNAKAPSAHTSPPLPPSGATKRSSSPSTSGAGRTSTGRRG